MRGVGYLHAGQRADHALILKDGLQRPLADFRLVRSVGGIEFGTTYDVIYHAGHVVIIGPGPQKTGIMVQVGIALAHPLQFPENLQLGERLWQGDLRETQRLRHVGKQVLDAVHPDGRQHRLPFGLAMGDVSHQ